MKANELKELLQTCFQNRAQQHSEEQSTAALEALEMTQVAEMAQTAGESSV